MALRDFDMNVELGSDHAATYLVRGSLHQEMGRYSLAVEDYDSAVRLYPQYETDFVDRRFVQGALASAEKAALFLKSRIALLAPQSPSWYYYTGLECLYSNDATSALDCFLLARELGYPDRVKLNRHISNLESRT